jgi:pre-mRNA-processing factor 40
VHSEAEELVRECNEPTIPHNSFATFEEGEKAFIYLLRKAGVDATWTWDQTMRAIITDPLYKALNSLAEKKATWKKVGPSCSSPRLSDIQLWQYTEGLKARDQEEREARLAKIRPAIRNMLKGNPNQPDSDKNQTMGF